MPNAPRTNQRPLNVIRQVDSKKVSLIGKPQHLYTNLKEFMVSSCREVMK